jgi:hypothetical protein
MESLSVIPANSKTDNLRNWSERKLTQADGIEILAAVYFSLCGQACESIADMHANFASQGTVLKLREDLHRQTYGGAR